MNLKKTLSYILGKRDSGSTLQANAIKPPSKEFAIYRSIDTLPVWNWDKAKKDSRYLLKLDNYDELPECSIGFAPIERSIANEVAKYSGSNAMSIYYDKTAELLDLRNKYNVLNDCLIAIKLVNHDEAIEIVKKYFPKYSGIEYLESQLTGIKKRYENKLAEYEYDYKKEDDGKEQDIYPMLEILGRWRGLDIDPFKTTVRQFLTIYNAYKNIPTK